MFHFSFKFHLILHCKSWGDYCAPVSALQQYCCSRWFTVYSVLQNAWLEMKLKATLVPKSWLLHLQNCLGLEVFNSNIAGEMAHPMMKNQERFVPISPAQGSAMPSNPGQNVHLASSQIHAVASSSHLANSSSQLVVLSSYLVESSSHLVVSSILLTSPLLVYSSVILQLVVSHFNSPCRTSTRRSLYPSSGQAVSRYK